MLPSLYGRFKPFIVFLTEPAIVALTQIKAPLQLMAMVRTFVALQ
jgi:hypothetical protein